MLKKDKLLQDCEEKNTFFRRRISSPASSFTRGQITLAKLREVGAAVTGCQNVIIQLKLVVRKTLLAISVSFLRNAIVPSVEIPLSRLGLLIAIDIMEILYIINI